MRFRLHNQNASQVKQNKTAIAALSSQVAAQSASSGQVTTVTTQVTGDDDVHTAGTLAIDNAELTAVTFADAFSSNGISHALDASIFNVTTAGEYSINVEIRVTDGTINAPGLYWVVCRIRLATHIVTTTLEGPITEIIMPPVKMSCWVEMLGFTSNRRLNSLKSSFESRISKT